MESSGSDIPAKPIEETKAAEKQVNGELQERADEEAEEKDDDEGSSEEEDGV